MAGVCTDLCLHNNVVCEGDACNAPGQCSPHTGKCGKMQPSNEGVVCRNGEGSCFNGVCTDICLKDKILCPSDECNHQGVCNPATGQCGDKTPLGDGRPCSSGVCQQGVCTDKCKAGGVICPASECHLPGECNPATGECSEPQIGNEGKPCGHGGKGGACENGVCTNMCKTQCPGDECNTPGTCDPSTGTCSQAVPRDDGTTCSAGLCLAGTCVDKCNGMTCPFDECNPAGDCDKMTGRCTVPPPFKDGHGCSKGACVEGVCRDRCVGIECAVTGECRQAGTCVSATGECTPETPVQDRTPCSNGGMCRSGYCSSGQLQSDDASNLLKEIQDQINATKTWACEVNDRLEQLEANKNKSSETQDSVNAQLQELLKAQAATQEKLTKLQGLRDQMEGATTSGSAALLAVSSAFQKIKASPLPKYHSPISKHHQLD